MRFEKTHFLTFLGFKFGKNHQKRGDRPFEQGSGNPYGDLLNLGGVEFGGGGWGGQIDEIDTTTYY